MAINKAVDTFCDDEIKIEKWLAAHSSEIDVEYEQSFQKWNGGYFYRMNEYREKGMGERVGVRDHRDRKRRQP